MGDPSLRVDLVIFVGRPGPSPVEHTVALVRQAAALDLISLAQACDLVGKIVVVTPVTAIADHLDGHVVHVDLDDAGEPFHFGRRLASVVDRFSIRHALYFGEGAAPLLSQRTLTRLCNTLLTGQSLVSANNFWSADFLGWTPASAIHQVDLPARRDNLLAVLLQRQAGLTRADLPASAGSLFDIDTPPDIAILNLHHGTYRHTRAALQAVPWGQDGWQDSQLAEIMPHLVRPGAEVCLVGRVSNSAFGGLRQDLACRLRIYAEERGMQASGRDRRGEVRSLLGVLLEQVGPTGFFAALAAVGADAVLMDTRVLFRHLGLDVSAADRFYSDLGCVEKIRNAEVRSFTAAACAAPMQVALGGQSLVGGGLWALTEAAWERADAGSLLTVR